MCFSLLCEIIFVLLRMEIGLFISVNSKMYGQYDS